jgi:hypothetical protein
VQRLIFLSLISDKSGLDLATKCLCCTKPRPLAASKTTPMIINLPRRVDYENVAKQCLVQAFNIIYNIDKDLIDVDPDVIDRDEVWNFHSGDLSTSLILVYQAMESLMKARVCDVSPLMLLDMKRTDWPTMPDSGDKDFNELFTIGGESLQRTFFAILSPASIAAEVNLLIERTRLTRNKIVHGVARDHLTPKSIVEAILNTFTFFFGKDSWWTTMREFEKNSPIFGHFDNDFEEAAAVNMLDYAESIVGLAELKAHSYYDLKLRRYYCPWCHEALESEGGELKSKSAYLIPQRTPGTIEVLCIGCQRTNAVFRDDCNQDDCPGNVIFEDEDSRKRCLTCLKEQNSEDATEQPLTQAL